MSPTSVQQIDAWRAAKSETEHLEFKEAKSQFSFDDLLNYCVAIGNEGGGHLLLGISNKPPRPVVGTSACTNTQKTALDLLNKLHFRVDIEEVMHPDGRVLVFQIPARPLGHPLQVNGTYYMRSGESLVAMTPDQLKKIFDERSSEPAPNRGRVIAVFISLFLVALAFIFLREITKVKSPSNSESLPQQPQGPNLAGDMLFMDCHYGVMPSAYPASGHLNVLVTSGTPGDSLADYFAPANSQARWNNTGKPEWAYRCEVTNYTKNVVANLEMIIHSTFRTPIPVIGSPNSFRQGDVTFDGDWTITAPKIDSGPESPFVFWIWNCCVDKFVQLRAPDSVTVGGSSGRRQISLTQSSGNLNQALMPNEKSKKEPPKTESPSGKKTSPAKPMEKSESPAFSVAVETKMLVPGPSKDVAGTGLWGVRRVGTSCYMWSADAAMFIRIRNLQSVRVMITAYNVYGIGGEYRRIRLDLNEPFRFVQRGRIPLPMHMPPGSGNVNGGFFTVPFQDIDFSRGYPVQAELLDQRIGEHYIEPNGIVRGWAFFEYPSNAAIPVRLMIKVSDDLGHVFSYPIPDEPGNPLGDTLPRVMTYGNPADLSSCIKQPHPAP